MSTLENKPTKLLQRVLFSWKYAQLFGLKGHSTCGYVKVTMNMLCARFFIIIFMMRTRKSEYIPTVTNFASILANYFYFLRKITALRPSILNFRGRLVKFWQKFLDKPPKNGFVSRGLRRMLLKILCSAHISSAAWKLPSTRPRYLC